MEIELSASADLIRNRLKIETVPRRQGSRIPLPYRTAAVIEEEAGVPEVGILPVTLRWASPDAKECEVVVIRRFSAARLVMAVSERLPITILRAITVLKDNNEPLFVATCRGYGELGFRRPTTQQDWDRGDSDAWWLPCDEFGKDAEFNVIRWQQNNHRMMEVTQSIHCPHCEGGWIANPCHNEIVVGDYDDYLLPSMNDLLGNADTQEPLSV